MWRMVGLIVMKMTLGHIDSSNIDLLPKIFGLS